MRRLEVESTRWSVLQDSLRKIQESLKSRTAVALDDVKDEASEKSPTQAAPDEISSSPREVGIQVNPELAVVPKDLSPDEFIKAWDLDSFLKDPQWNPEGKKFSRVVMSRMVEEATQARARMEILTTSLQREAAEGMEKMFQEGNYVDYARGEHPVPVPGVFSVAEDLESGGMRLYYFYREQHPGVFEKREERARIARSTTGKLLAMLKE